jgi:hypothetical protein
MKPFVALIVFVALMVFPNFANAQRFGYSVGMPSAGVQGSTAAPAPTLPLLPSLFPAAPAPALHSLPLSVQPLDLTSLHLVPTTLVFGPVNRRPILPQLPFPMDPLAGVISPQMCVDPMPLHFSGAPDTVKFPH